MQKTALITGITGQDGCYLAKFLLNKGYKVIGLVRSKNNFNSFGLKYLNILDEVALESCDLLRKSEILNLIKKYSPDEIYNLAGKSSVGESFKGPYETLNFNIISVLNFLESLRILSDKTIKFFQASSCEIFGNSLELPFRESSRIYPISPYGLSKATGHLNSVNYRESYGLFSCCGILFNHESFLRTNNFFVKKIIRESILISRGKKDVLRVGTIDIKRDFGYAPKYVEAMWLILQQERPDDFIICSGNSISLRKIIDFVFSYFLISEDKLIIEESFVRKNEAFDIYGDNTKAKKTLGWNYEMDFFKILDLLIKEELENQIVHQQSYI